MGIDASKRPNGVKAFAPLRKGFMNPMYNANQGQCSVAAVFHHGGPSVVLLAAHFNFELAHPHNGRDHANCFTSVLQSATLFNVRLQETAVPTLFERSQWQVREACIADGIGQYEAC